MPTLGFLWAFPITFIGLLLAVLAAVTGGSVQFRQGVVEAQGGFVAWLLRGGRFWRGGAAMTLGHVILARDANCLAQSRAHELMHVRQYERCGSMLPIVYWLVGAWLSWRGFDPYLDHPFEQFPAGPS